METFSCPLYATDYTPDPGTIWAPNLLADEEKSPLLTTAKEQRPEENWWREIHTG